MTGQPIITPGHFVPGVFCNVACHKKGHPAFPPCCLELHSAIPKWLISRFKAGAKFSLPGRKRRLYGLLGVTLLYHIARVFRSFPQECGNDQKLCPRTCRYTPLKCFAMFTVILKSFAGRPPVLLLIFEKKSFPSWKPYSVLHCSRFPNLKSAFCLFRDFGGPKRVAPPDQGGIRTGRAEC